MWREDKTQHLGAGPCQQTIQPTCQLRWKTLLRSRSATPRDVYHDEGGVAACERAVRNLYMAAATVKQIHSWLQGGSGIRSTADLAGQYIARGMRQQRSMCRDRRLCVDPDPHRAEASHLLDWLAAVRPGLHTLTAVQGLHGNCRGCRP